MKESDQSLRTWISIVLVFAILYTACSNQEQTPTDKIVGKWKLHEIVLDMNGNNKRESVDSIIKTGDTGYIVGFGEDGYYKAVLGDQEVDSVIWEVKDGHKLYYQSSRTNYANMSEIVELNQDLLILRDTSSKKPFRWFVFYRKNN
jgi:hypothetical protein